MRPLPHKSHLVVGLGTIIHLFLSSACAGQEPSGRPSQILNQRNLDSLDSLGSPYKDLPGVPEVSTWALERTKSMRLRIPDSVPEGQQKVVDLFARYAENPIGPYRYRHRSYNGALVGPVIKVKPGDELYISLRNDFPPGSS